MITYEFNHFIQPTVRPLLRFPGPSYKTAPQQRERSVSTFVTRIPRKRVSQKPNANLMEHGPPSVCTVDVSFLTKINTSDSLFISVRHHQHVAMIGLIFVADCGMPPRIPNTFIQAPGPTTEGSEIVYGCIENYVSEGDPSIFCKENGLWTKPTLYCRRMLFTNAL